MDHVYLNQSKLTVGEEEQLFTEQMIIQRIPWFMLHQIHLSLFKGEADRGQEVGPEVNAEDCEDSKG